MTIQKIPCQFGLWNSQLTPRSIAGEMTFTDVLWDDDGTLVWSERRSGRNILVVQPSDTRQAIRELSGEFAARAGVGYGGGDFTVGLGVVYFVEAESGRIFRQPIAGGTARPITPAFGQAAAPALSPDGRWLLYVHSDEGQDCLGIVDTFGESWPAKLVSGDDFYMQPSWHPASDGIAWVAWNYPNMPWDGSFLRIGKLAVTSNGSIPVVSEVETIAGTDQISIFQPEFSPDGRYLAYVSDEGGWWDIYLFDLERGERRPLTQGRAECGVPAWTQGLRTFGFSPDSNHIYFIRNQSGFASLWRVDINTAEQVQLPVGEQYTWLKEIAVEPGGKRMAFIASGGRTPYRVIVHDPVQGVQTVRRSMAEDIPEGAFAAPQAITWNGLDGGTVHGLFYLPQNEDYFGIGLPPLIVIVHGGPTSQRMAEFYSQEQFFTTRGYAVLQVNYRGSTGYGRAYRDMLRGNWGIYDVEDSLSGARFLAEQGLVDPKRMVIMGGSAGGFTVLKTLQDYPGFFKAGINLFGVANQFSFLLDTHKFEARYSDYLLGPLPEAADIYRERSPLFFAEKIQDPLAIFQGGDDKVVPRDQSDQLAEVLQSRGIPHIYHVYEGEGHGFRKAETLEHFYSAVDRFLKQYVIFN